MADHYHHGNLRQTLIDTGIRIINEQGEDSLSLRKVAAACGVSHAAPYFHFQDKEALLEAMKESVMNQFTEKLNQALEIVQNESIEDRIDVLGKEYMRFFIHHPDYFSFLFYKQSLQIHITLEKNYDDDYKPFLLFKSLFLEYIEKNHIAIPEKQMEILLIKKWAIVHGISSIICMKNMKCELDWESCLDDFIQ